MYIPSDPKEAAEFWCPFGRRALNHYVVNTDFVNSNLTGCKGKRCACFILSPTNSEVGRCGLIQKHKF